ncbi:MAG: tetratricopeptide repeat protein [Anaerolineae bacterium]|nr:tetratricopeptide repeat protein [Anaerolineae bacterium]
MRDVPEGQRSLRAVFDSSYQRLSEAEQSALAHLTVFRGGFREEAATAVLGIAARGMLTSLLDKSLIRRDANGRYELHELVRQYASDKLNPAEPALERHAAYFADFLAAQQSLFRTAHEREAVQAARTEADNLRQMWRTASQWARADLLDKALISLCFMHDILGWYDEGIAQFALAIECLADKPESDAVRARLMTRRASLARSVGRYDEAERWFSEGLALAHEVGDESNQAYALRQLGFFPMVRGDLDNGLASMNESLRLYRAHNDLPRIADALMSVGIAQLRLGQMEQAVAMYQEAADILAEVGDEVGHAMAQDNLGDAAYYRGEFEAALRHYTAAADVQRRYDERRQLAISQNNAADVLCQLRRWDEALVAAQESADLFREMSSRDGAVHALHSQAMALLGTGDMPRASDCYAEVLALGTQLHAEADLLNLLVLGGRLLAALGQHELAAQLLRFVQGNPASAAFTTEGAASALRELPEEVVVRVLADSTQTWTTAQAVESVLVALS